MGRWPGSRETQRLNEQFGGNENHACFHQMQMPALRRAIACWRTIRRQDRPLSKVPGKTRDSTASRIRKRFATATFERATIGVSRSDRD